MTERDPDTARFDPRFDPAFQPGYEPGDEARHEPGHEPAAGAARGPSTFAPAPVPLAQPPHRTRDVDARDDRAAVERDDADRSANTGAYDDGAGDDPFGVVDVESDDSDDDDAARSSVATNPFLIALWVLSVVFIVVGVWLTVWIPELMVALNSAGGATMANAEFNFYLSQTASALAPMLILLGLATAVGILFVYAAHSLRARSRRA
ncbi:hypothetical protein [Marisediminicola sp. LYQ134]|uniref:hypothetical protein n=1 Tax=Marisediminicola sp. LYQ134 TaxID=3391061 RepID=UPI003982EA76